MTELIDVPAATNADGTFATAATSGRGSTVMTVSNEWARRPADERFLSLDALYAKTSAWADASTMLPAPVHKMRVEVGEGNVPLTLDIGDGEARAMTPWAFDQLCSKVGAPRNFMRRIPPFLAGVNVQWMLDTHAAEEGEDAEFGAYAYQNGQKLVRSLTSMRYGRIFDRDVVRAVQQVATGSKHEWKVPGSFDWSSPRASGGRMIYNPNAPVTLDSTTIYGSDRDVFMFLVQDRNPLVIGKLDNGDDDVVFRGIIIWNSEVGSKTFGIAAMYLRGVCCNRILWGVEGYRELSMKHTSGAPERFVADTGPTLEAYSEAAGKVFLDAVREARKPLAILKNDEGRVDFLATRVGTSEKQARAIIDLHQLEEQHPMVSVWDVTQGVTAYARANLADNADERFAFEGRARKLLEKVKA